MQRKKTNNLDQLKRAMESYNELTNGIYSNYSKKYKVEFPEYRILDAKGITTNISTCCVVILFNDDQNYFFGHFNSRTYKRIDSNKTHDMFEDLLLGMHEVPNASAIVVAGDTLFFNEIVVFLKNNHVPIIASYLDDSAENDVSEGFTNKTVTFNPSSKVAIVYSPILPAGKIELKNQNITLYDLQNDLIKGRDATIQDHLDSEIRLGPMPRTSTPPGRRFSLFEHSCDSPEQRHERAITIKEKSSPQSFRSLNVFESFKKLTISQSKEAPTEMEAQVSPVNEESPNTNRVKEVSFGKRDKSPNRKT